MATRHHLINIIILICLSLVVRVGIVAFHGFDGLYGQDAFAYYNFAGELLAFVKSRAIPPPFFWSIGYPLHLAVSFGIVGQMELIALSISIIMGSLLAALVYIFALQLNLRSPYAFCAGLLMAFSGQALQSSLVIMSDIPALFWAVISGMTFLKYIETDKRRWLILCGFAISIACLTRLIYLILPPLFVLTLLTIWKHRIRWIDLILTLIVGIVPIVPQIIYNQVNPTALLNHSWVRGWSPVNTFAQNFVNIDGTFQYETINALFYAYPIYDLSYLSPLLTIFVFTGLINVFRQRTPQSILLIGWLLLSYLFLAGIPYQNIRFPLIVFPVVAVLVGQGLQRLASLQNSIRWIAILITLAGIAHTAINGFDYANNFVEHHQSQKQIVTWLDDKIPDDATLYTFGSTLTLEHYTDYNVIEIFYETPNTLNQRWFQGRTDYLLLNIWQIENQWDGRDPQANYHWFRDERGLNKIDTFRNFTLFEAHP